MCNSYSHTPTRRLIMSYEAETWVEEGSGLGLKGYFSHVSLCGTNRHLSDRFTPETD